MYIYIYIYTHTHTHTHPIYIYIYTLIDRYIESVFCFLELVTRNSVVRSLRWR
jgi:hypothetical protein